MERGPNYKRSRNRKAIWIDPSNYGTAPIQYVPQRTCRIGTGNQYVKEFGLGLTTWSPLYSGILSGKYNKGIPEGSRASLDDMSWIRDRITSERINKVNELTNLARNLNITTSQLAIAWLLRRKEVSSVITGASRLEQMDENLLAADAVELLDDNILETIEQILDNNPLG